MEGFETIVTRRSIRKYTAEPVSEELIKKLLDAAMSAPSAGNQQPWHFVVVTDRAVLDEIPKVHVHAQMVKGAPLAIAVCADTAAEKHKGFWIQDCAAATQNILLAAHALGLGAVWLGVHPRDERVAGVSKLLGLPANVVPLSLISIGYPAEEKPRADRYDEARVHRNRW